MPSYPLGGRPPRRNSAGDAGGLPDVIIDNGGGGVADRESLVETARPPSESQAQVAADGATIPIPYGEPRIGARVAAAVTDSVGRLVLLCVFSRGPVESLDVTIDDAAPPAGVIVTKYLGTSTQTPNASLVSAYLLQGKTYADALPGIAYAVVEIPQGLTNGFPQIAAKVKGLKVFDPRVVLRSVKKDLTTSWADVGTPSLAANSDPARDLTMTAHRLTDNDGNDTLLSGREFSWTVANDSKLRSFSISVSKTAATPFSPGVGLRYSGGGTPTSYVVKVNTFSGAATVHSGAGGFVTVVDRATHWEIIVRLANNASGHTNFHAAIYAAVY